MNDSQLRVGVIGAGRMGITHFSIINAHPDVRVVAVADTSTVSNTMLEKYTGVATYTDYGKLLERERPNAVLVCTPPTLNADVLNRAAAVGAHAFVEKPFMTVLTEAQAAVRLYEEHRLVNQVGYVNRFNDMFGKLRSLLEAGVLGRVVRFRSEMFSQTVIRPDDGVGWRGKRETGGGATYEMAAHAIDLINFLFGRPARVVGTSMSRVFSRQVEDVVSSTFLYDNGIVGSIYVNWSDASYRKPTNKLEVFGERGRLVADQHGMKIYLTEADAAQGLKSGWNSIYITDVFSSVPFFVRGIEFTAQLYHFVDCIRLGLRGPRPRCTFGDGLATLSVIDEMFRDAETNGGVRAP